MSAASAEEGAPPANPAPRLTEDRFLDGRFAALQPARGHHRSGLEAILLAAAVGDDAALVVDLGAGAGVAGMAVAARLAAARVVLVEREAELCAAAAAALVLPVNAAMANRITIAATDIAAPEAARVAAGVPHGAADYVILNPPFRDASGGTASPEAARAGAHVLAEGGFGPWLRAAASALSPDGTTIAIIAAGRLPDLLAAAEGRFGSLVVLPVHPRPGASALRVLVRGRKGGRSPFALLPGLVVHAATGNAYSPALEAMLRDGAALAEIHPPWRPEAGRGPPRGHTGR